jgi:hypothetical protein
MDVHPNSYTVCCVEPSLKSAFITKLAEKTKLPRNAHYLSLGKLIRC